jgi:hypothetical protein
MFFLSSNYFYLFSSPSFFLFLFPLTLSLSHRPCPIPTIRTHHARHSGTVVFLADLAPPRKSASPASLANPPVRCLPHPPVGPPARRLRRLRWLRRPASSAAGEAAPAPTSPLHCPAPPPSSSSARALPRAPPLPRAITPSSPSASCHRRPPPPRGPTGGRLGNSRRSGRSCKRAASPRLNCSRKRESREVGMGFATEAVSGDPLAQLRLQKLRQRHPL